MCADLKGERTSPGPSPDPAPAPAPAPGWTFLTGNGRAPVRGYGQSDAKWAEPAASPEAI